LEPKNIRTAERLNNKKALDESRIYLFFIGSALLFYSLIETLKSILRNNLECNKSIFIQDTYDLDYDYCELSDFKNKFTIVSKKD
jgi:hypothetical protein